MNGAMTDHAAHNLGAIKAGVCYDCAGDLQGPRLDRFWICAQCGRGFRLDGDEVTERIPLGPDWRGKVDMGDVRLVMADGSTVLPERDEHDMVDLTGDEVAVECTWRGKIGRAHV